MQRKVFLFIKPVSVKNSEPIYHSFTYMYAGYLSTPIFFFFTYMLVLSRNYQGVFEALALCTAMSYAGWIESTAFDPLYKAYLKAWTEASEDSKELEEKRVRSMRVDWEITRFFTFILGMMNGAACSQLCSNALGLYFNGSLPLTIIVVIFLTFMTYVIPINTTQFYYFRVSKFLKNTYSELKLVSFQPAKDILLSTLKIIVYTFIVTSLIMALNYVSKIIIKEYIVDNALNLIQDAS